MAIAIRVAHGVSHLIVEEKSFPFVITENLLQVHDVWLLLVSRAGTGMAKLIKAKL